jgi:hypothetical protein
MSQPPQNDKGQFAKVQALRKISYGQQKQQQQPILNRI